MRWKFTKHARDRIEERDYHADHVLMVLNGETPSYVIPSPRDANIDLVFAKLGIKFALIVVDRFSKNIITIRPMRKNEKAEYRRRMEAEND